MHDRMFRRLVTGLAVSGALAMATTSCVSADKSAPVEVGRPAVTSALNRLTGTVPGAQAVVTERGHSWTAIAGLGDLERRAPFPDGAHVRIGSNTKTFTATVVLQLVAEGKVDLDAPVERYLPGVVHGAGIDGERITIRNLLQHTSGLPAYDQLVGAEFDRNPLTRYETTDLVRRAMTLPAQFPPGAGWSYSNTNYLVAGMVIERVTGNSVAAEITRRIITPLGLTATYYPAAGETALREPHPTGYYVIDGQRVDHTRIDPSVAGAAGAMVGTGADLNRFFTALLSGELLPPAQLAEMKRTVTAGHPDRPFGYGLGLMHRTLSCGKESWSHGGDFNGFETRGGVTADGRAVTVSVNQIPETPEGTNEVMNVVDTALCASS